MHNEALDALLVFIIESIGQIRYEMRGIEESDDFLQDREGLMRLDAVAMRLQAIGEALKNIDKRFPKLLEQYASPEYWSGIMRMRDVISHHYINIDAEIVYEVCTGELDRLEELIEAIRLAS